MREIAASLYAGIHKYLYWINIPRIAVSDVVEIIIIAFVMYSILSWIKNTRAWALLRGIIVILIFLVLVAVFQLNVILWLAAKLANVAIIALVIIFQPELRSALDSLGRRSIFGRLLNIDFGKNAAVRYSEDTISAIVKACYDMGKVKTGALIVIERDVQLQEYVRTGIALDSIVSRQLLVNIFEHNTPLHDGAIIVRGDRIVSATCYLPLSANMDLSKDLGTRHRAAVGISEVSDSLTIVVSEETGSVSVALEGTLYQHVDADFLSNKLYFAGKLDREGESWRERIKGQFKGREKDEEAGRAVHK